MPSLSDRQKKMKIRKAVQERLAKGVDAYRAELQKEPNLRKGLRTVAEFHGVNHNTLARAVKDKRNIDEANAMKQKLTVAEEGVLVDFILKSADRGFPLAHRTIEPYANAILQKRLGMMYQPVGKKWIYAFLDRNRHKLQTHWSRSLDMQRAQSLNPEAVKHWFDLVEELVVKTGIENKNIYGMDESGFPSADQGRSRIVGARGTKVQHKQGGADCENTTALVTICADGTSLRPTIVFKGKGFKEAWFKDNVLEALICHSPKGWTNGDIALQWMIKDFSEQTHDKAQGQTRVLILDGHSSHYTPELLEYARDNNIIILGYPPHCTHALQGLDVVCFARMKEHWKQVINEFETLHRTRVSKTDFTSLFGQAYRCAFTTESIEAAFQVTGVFPFDCTVITEKQMRPSEATSTKGTFAVTYTSPVNAILTSFKTYRPTALEMSPSNARPPPQSIPHTSQPLPPTDHATHLPDGTNLPTPSPKRAREPVIDPLSLTPETPSKHMRMMVSQVAAAQSGSFLLLRAKFTSAQPFPRLCNHAVPTHVLPEPKWDLIEKPPPRETLYQSKTQLRQQIEELTKELALAKQVIEYREQTEQANSALLVIQDITLQKMNDTLYARENVKKPKRNQIFAGGKGRHLTSSESIAAIRADQDACIEAENQKRQRQGNREKRKVDLARIELEWKAIKVLHAKKVKEWVKECAMLSAEGSLKKDLPKKPVCALKPKLPKGPRAPQNDPEACRDDDDSDVSTSSDEEEDD